MTARVPRFDFMPYGAPELLGASRRTMLRAQVSSCLVVGVAFFAAWLLMPRLPSPQARHSPSIWLDPMPAPSQDPIKIAETKRPTPIHATPDRGEVIPVAHETQEIEPGSVRVDSRNESDDGGAIEAAPPQPGTVAVETLPTRQDYVYVDELPVTITKIEPIYSDIAQMAGVDGRVLVHILIGKDGRVLRAEVDERIHVPMLDPSALEAARRCIFQPAMVNQHPIAVWETIPFVFRLR